MDIWVEIGLRVGGWVEIGWTLGGYYLHYLYCWLLLGLFVLLVLQVFAVTFAIAADFAAVAIDVAVSTVSLYFCYCC